MWACSYCDRTYLTFRETCDSCGAHETEGKPTPHLESLAAAGMRHTSTWNSVYEMCQRNRVEVIHYRGAWS